MANVCVEVKQNDLQRIDAVLGGIKDGVADALSSIMNKGLTTVQNETYKQISRVYYLTRENLRADTNITLKRANRSNPIGEILFSGHKLPLYRYNVTPIKPTPHPMGRIPVKFPNGWAMATPGAQVSAAKLRSVRPKPFKSAFIAEMRSGHRGIFDREYGDSLPIKELMGDSTAQMANNSAVLPKIEEKAQKMINDSIETAITRVLNR